MCTTRNEKQVGFIFSYGSSSRKKIIIIFLTWAWESNRRCFLQPPFLFSFFFFLIFLFCLFLRFSSVFYFILNKKCKNKTKCFFFNCGLFFFVFFLTVGTIIKLCITPQNQWLFTLRGDVSVNDCDSLFRFRLEYRYQ